LKVPKRPSSPEFRREVALRLKQAIRKHELTHSKAAKLLGVTRQTLWLYLHEKSAPGSVVLKKACQLWKLSLSVGGFDFDDRAFGPSGKQRPKPRQLDLFEALEQLRPDQIETKVIGRVRGSYELRVRIKVAS
jgi:transcriptional regulator with XRE-family HTH domain